MMLTRVMTNIGGPRNLKRRILATVVASVALYAAPVWAPRAGEYALFRSELEKAQRPVAIGVCAAYRTTSTIAAQVVSGTHPLDLLAQERCERRSGTAKDVARERLMGSWQARWLQEEKAAWTRRMIPDLKPWVERKRGDVNHWLTQVLTGHGAFNTYLARIRKLPTGTCNTCTGDEDTVEHVVYHCPRWHQLRRTCFLTTGLLTPDNTVSKMLEREECWKAVDLFVCELLQEKTRDMPARGH